MHSSQGSLLAIVIGSNISLEVLSNRWLVDGVLFLFWCGAVVAEVCLVTSLLSAEVATCGLKLQTALVCLRRQTCAPAMLGRSLPMSVVSGPGSKMILCRRHGCWHLDTV